MSIHDALMEEADQAARDLGLSRNELIAEALRSFLRQHRQAQVTEQLNKAHESGPTPGERLFTSKLKSKLPVTNAW